MGDHDDLLPGGCRWYRGEEVNRALVRLWPRRTRYFDFTVPLDEYSAYVDVLIHLTARQARTEVWMQDFHTVRLDRE